MNELDKLEKCLDIAKNINAKRKIIADDDQQKTEKIAKFLGWILMPPHETKFPQWGPCPGHYEKAGEKSSKSLEAMGKWLATVPASLAMIYRLAEHSPEGLVPVIRSIRIDHWQLEELLNDKTYSFGTSLNAALRGAVLEILK